MIIRKTLQLCGAAAVITLAGCAPVTFAVGNGFGISTGPDLNLNVSSCNPLSGYSAQAARLGITSSAIQAGAIRNRISSIQSRYMAGSSWIRKDMQSWKRVASGECG
jgi:hypothetical protein